MSILLITIVKILLYVWCFLDIKWGSQAIIYGHKYNDNVKEGVGDRLLNFGKHQITIAILFILCIFTISRLRLSEEHCLVALIILNCIISIWAAVKRNHLTSIVEEIKQELGIEDDDINSDSN